MTQMASEALTLGDRICDFIVAAGGPCKDLTGELQRVVFYALGSRQYVLKVENDKIVYFASWWKIHPEDVQSVKGRVEPADVSHGSVLYVTEAVCRSGYKETAEMIRRIREQAAPFTGVFWHRPVKADRVYHFARQKGKEVGPWD